MPMPRPHRPLVPAALAFAAGVGLADLAALSPAEWIGAALGLAAVAACAWARRLPSAYIAVALCLTLAALGGARLGVARAPRPDGVAGVPGDGAIVVLEGVVAGDVQTYGKGLTARADETDVPVPSGQRRSAFALDVERFQGAEGWQTASGRIKVNVYAEPPAIARGDRVQVTGRLGTPPAPLNPGQFDYRRHLALRGIERTLRVSAQGSVRRLARPAGVGPALLRWRQALAGVLARSVPGPEATLVAALVLGLRGELASDLEDAFQRSGTVHVLAVSGLHVGMVAAIFWGLLRLARCPRRAALAAMLLGLGLYAVLSGGSPSVVRATVMAAAFFGAELVWRRPESGNSLALAALALLAWNPTDLWDVGFQLSTVSVIGLIAVAPRVQAALVPAPDPLLRILPSTPWERVRREAWAVASGSVAITLGAWGAAWPLVADTFHVVTPVVVLSNLVVGPLVWLLLALGLAVLAVGWLPLAVTWPLGYATGGIALMLEWTVRGAAALPGAWAAVPGVSLRTMLVYYGALGAWAWLRPSWRAVGILAGGLVLAGGSWWLDLRPGPPPPVVRATFLAVGHGCALALEFPDGKTAVVDLGSAGTLDVGAEVAAPALWARGVRRVDTLFISHPDSDHYDGVLSLSERMAIGEVVTTPYFDASPQGRAFIEELARRGIPRRTLAAPQRVRVADRGEVRVLWPPAGLDASKFKDNDLCLVLLVAAAGSRVLLSADVEAKAIAGLMAQGEAIRCDVLAVPHHGSKGSLDPALIAACRPRYVVISSDARFVSADVREAYATAGARVLETWRDGAVAVTFGADGLRVEAFR